MAKDKIITFKCDETFYVALSKLAAAYGETLGETIRGCIAHGVPQWRKEQKALQAEKERQAETAVLVVIPSEK